MIRKELLVFLVVGTLTVVVDFVTYRGLRDVVGWETSVAKVVGFIAGTVFAYFANRFWTFGHHTYRAGSAVRFVLLYASTLAANVLINKLMLHALDGMAQAVQLAFLSATGVSAVLNFLGMKYFVFATTAVKGAR